MSGISVVMVVHNQLALTRACLESLRHTTVDFELAVVDNASTDGTRDYLESLTWPARRAYARHDENVGLIRALNAGAQLAHGDLLCFIHNDTEMLTPSWLGRLRDAVTAGAGLAGLYGARRLRRDGRYAGRSIVHCLSEGANVTAPITVVAAVDGVCLCLARSTLEAVKGFDERYGFFHGYDRDLSFAVRETGLPCVVVDAPFIHRGGGTRTGTDTPIPAARDLTQRRAALTRFATKWHHRLPCDVRTRRQRLTDWWQAQRSWGTTR
jgi:GT2 family glycosyltransferase